MPVKARVMFRRWFHHRTRSDYRELSEDNENLLSEKINDWTTVPGLIVEEDEAYLSVEDDTEQVLLERVVKKDSTKKTSSALSLDEEAFDEVVQRLSGSQSFETLETEEESDLAEHEQQNPKRQRTIRWADSHGKDLVHQHEIQILPPLNVRIVILMLNPAEKIFEFVQCEFSTEPEDRLTVSDLLVQLPFMASMDALKKQRYNALYRGDREMVNIISIQDYDIKEGEILVAVASATNPKHSIAAAAALLLQRSLLRAVQKAKLSGRALQKLMSSTELAAVIEGTLPEPQNPFDDEDESRDDCRLVLRVLNRELGCRAPLSPAQRCAPTNEEEEAGEDFPRKEENEEEEFPFVPVPELDQNEFQQFQEATIDPYSPIARGRMAELPQALLASDLNIFEPPFETSKEEDDFWDEVSSDEAEFEHEVSSLPSSSTDEDDEELALVDEYIGMTAFSDVFDREEEDEEDDLIMSVALGAADDRPSIEPASSEESTTESTVETSHLQEHGEGNSEYDSDDLSLHDLGHLPIPHFHEEIEPIPELEDDDECDVELHQDHQTEQVGTAQAHEAMICSPDEVLLPAPPPNTVSEEETQTSPNTRSGDDQDFNIPEIIPVTEEEEEEGGEGSDKTNGLDNGENNAPNQLVIGETTTFLATVVLLIGAVVKVSSTESGVNSTLQPQLRTIGLDEAEV